MFNVYPVLLVVELCYLAHPCLCRAPQLMLHKVVVLVNKHSTQCSVCFVIHLFYSFVLFVHRRISMHAPSHIACSGVASGCSFNHLSISCFRVIFERKQVDLMSYRNRQLLLCRVVVGQVTDQTSACSESQRVAHELVRYSASTYPPVCYRQRAKHHLCEP